MVRSNGSIPEVNTASSTVSDNRIEHSPLMFSVSWNFRHIVNLGRIRLFNAVNLEEGYGLIEIRTPKEVLSGGKGI